MGRRAANEAPDALKRRLSLVDQLNAETKPLNDLAAAGTIKDSQAKAVAVISSDAVRKAVDLASAPAKDRERYGRNLFGQSVMLGKRPLDTGVRLVRCNWQRVQVSTRAARSTKRLLW